ncbi:hypothetical protein [Lapillicoccus jejuensis]|uniref:Uncharacterized protein n=1 Tax=Lapillicoccus jejuensis TaxID=402171 RepID=A0A542E190_9MICO|nr:hypothetical protein [Lapillicoccus jejuensis]TQJ09121.1 hypothetical protein FB458_2227 [Lapillicoccus jejuensis]
MTATTGPTGLTEAVLPHPKAVRDLLEGLLGRTVDLKPQDSWTPGPYEPVCVAEMRADDGHLLAVVALDLALTVYVGAAIGLAPAGGAQDMVKGQDPSPMILANTVEVLNVLSAAWNVGDNPHTRLGPVHQPGQALPTRLEELLAAVGRREDLRVDVAGYGSGSLALVAV